MTTFTRTLASALAAAFLSQTAAAAGPAVAQTPFLPVADEAPARLVVQPPLSERLPDGVALIPYRTENFRILPVFGPGAVGVSPRAGHLHVTVDDLPWHWADAGAGETVVVAGLPPGPHKVLIELALPDHRVIASEAVSFVVPPARGPHAGH